MEQNDHFSITAEKLAAAFKLLAGDATMKARAQEIAAALAREDGVTGLVDACGASGCRSSRSR